MISYVVPCQSTKLMQTRNHQQKQDSYLYAAQILNSVDSHAHHPSMTSEKLCTQDCTY